MTPLHSLLCKVFSSAAHKCTNHLWKTYSTVEAGRHFVILPEVQQALSKGKPVVALESTLITHGMPYPENLQTAQALVRIVRENGAIPATVGIINGKFHVGLSKAALELLAKKEHNPVKVSIHDLPVVVAQKLYGGTTVASSMFAASLVGISIFVTGGIGGVHRGAEKTMDISADLVQMGRTPIAVVCAGVKSILDIGLTLEYLETQGVCVATYGTEKDFPAFFAQRSDYKAIHNVKNSEEAAMLIDASLSLGLNRSVLIGVPIPQQFAETGREVEDAIQTSLVEAKRKYISGKDVTPFVLHRVNELTEGKSLQANIALLKNNAEVGSRIACKLASRRRREGQHFYSFADIPMMETRQKPVVIGGTNLDILVALMTEDGKVMMDGSTNKGKIQYMLGGVGRNISEGLQKFGKQPLFITATGPEQDMQKILKTTKPIEAKGLLHPDYESTASYVVILRGNGELFAGIGDMDIHNSLTPELIAEFKPDLEVAPLVVFDGNVPVKTMQYVCEICSEAAVPVWFEPADTLKARKPFEKSQKTKIWKMLTYTSPNLRELRQIGNCLGIPSSEQPVDSMTIEEIADECSIVCEPLMRHIHTVFLTLDKHGVLIITRGDLNNAFPLTPLQDEQKEVIRFYHYQRCLPEQEPDEIVSVSGAGDCMASATIMAMLEERSIDEAVKAGLKAAQLSICSADPIPPELSIKDFTVSAVRSWATWEPKLIMERSC